MRRVGCLSRNRLQYTALFYAGSVEYRVDMAWGLVTWAGIVTLAFRANQILVSNQLEVLVSSEEVLLCVFGIAAAGPVNKVRDNAILVFDAGGVRKRRLRKQSVGGSVFIDRRTGVARDHCDGSEKGHNAGFTAMVLV